MTSLTSKQRKFAYLLVIALLAIPIYLEGMPAGTEGAGGGKLAQLRVYYELGEPTLGKVDPSSATMNLVLLGLRGVATDLLWLDYLQYQETKNWAEMRSTVESIILLQPHFTKVWRHNGWNLAWNVSAEWDAVEDRYYWLKEGIKFLQQGSARNNKTAELFFDTGRTTGQKIGVADEKAFYAKFFLNDPDTERFKGGADLQINPQEKPHYLAARDVYLKANEVENKYGQRSMVRELFRQYPAHSLLVHAAELQNNGNFGEVTRAAWNEAFDKWTGEFGQENFTSPFGRYHLEMNEDDIKASALEQKIKVQELQNSVDSNQRLVNYRYWRTRALSESEPLTEDAHREIYEGQQAFKDAKLSTAKQLLESGMAKFAQVLKKYPSIAVEDDAIDESLKALLYWRYILQLQQEPIPRDYPLSFMWNAHQPRVVELDRRFKIDNGLQ